MNITKEELELIEQALQTAIAAESNDDQIRSYRNVLKRLHADRSGGPQPGFGMMLEDGFRYDYDDASDLRG
ncbi:hypothetical protein [Gorillibacterium sp. sgz5001074]|uniref:hypothetical protein n=1 Tax=Gorillibacterium sp. sgz5001074 TaxID=3446695 RepID=UPI003F681FA6